MASQKRCSTCGTVSSSRAASTRWRRSRSFLVGWAKAPARRLPTRRTLVRRAHRGPRAPFHFNSAGGHGALLCNWKGMRALIAPLPTLLGCFAQRGDLHEQIAWIDIRMIIRKKIERHHRNFRPQLIERRCVSRSRNVVAVPAPNRRLLVPDGRNRKDHWFGHAGSQLAALASKSTITFQAMEGGLPQSSSAVGRLRFSPLGITPRLRASRRAVTATENVTIRKRVRWWAPT